MCAFVPPAGSLLRRFADDTVTHLQSTGLKLVYRQRISTFLVDTLPIIYKHRQHTDKMFELSFSRAAIKQSERIQFVINATNPAEDVLRELGDSRMRLVVVVHSTSRPDVRFALDLPVSVTQLLGNRHAARTWLATAAPRHTDTPLFRCTPDYHHPVAVCMLCGKEDGLKLCSACKNVAYCSKECQRADWGTHRHGCSS